MIPLIVLLGAILLARATGRFWVRALDSWAAATRVGLAVMFWFTATAHFNFMREDLVRMVPPWVPYPEFMVTFTGVAEIAGGIGALEPGDESSGGDRPDPALARRFAGQPACRDGRRDVWRSVSDTARA